MMTWAHRPHGVRTRGKKSIALFRFGMHAGGFLILCARYKAFKQFLRCGGFQVKEELKETGWEGRDSKDPKRFYTYSGP